MSFGQMLASRALDATFAPSVRKDLRVTPDGTFVDAEGKPVHPYEDPSWVARTLSPQASDAKQYNDQSDLMNSTALQQQVVRHNVAKEGLRAPLANAFSVSDQSPFGVMNPAMRGMNLDVAADLMPSGVYNPQTVQDFSQGNQEIQGGRPTYAAANNVDAAKYRQQYGVDKLTNRAGAAVLANQAALSEGRLPMIPQQIRNEQTQLDINSGDLGHTLTNQPVQHKIQDAVQGIDLRTTGYRASQNVVPIANGYGALLDDSGKQIGMVIDPAITREQEMMYDAISPGWRSQVTHKMMQNPKTGELAYVQIKHEEPKKETPKAEVPRQPLAQNLFGDVNNPVADVVGAVGPLTNFIKKKEAGTMQERINRKVYSDSYRPY